MPKFEYLAPKTMGGTLSLLSQYGARAKVAAGRTDPLVGMKERKAAPDYLISLEGVSDLDCI